jgi:hypothetical protein
MHVTKRLQFQGHHGVYFDSSNHPFCVIAYSSVGARRPVLHLLHFLVFLLLYIELALRCSVIMYILLSKGVRHNYEDAGCVLARSNVNSLDIPRADDGLADVRANHNLDWAENKSCPLAA